MKEFKDTSMFKGENWQNYVSPSIDMNDVYSGTYLAQLAKALLYARSFGKLGAGNRFVFPVMIPQPFAPSKDVTGFTSVQQFQGAESMIPGGEIGLGTQFTAWYESDSQFAMQRWKVRPFDMAEFQSDYNGATLEYYQRAIDLIPGGGIIFEKLRTALSDYSVSRLGWWRPSPVSFSTRGASTAGGMTREQWINRRDNTGGGKENTNNAVPWIIAAVVASQLL
jgi:hypothetical protein